MVLVSNYPGLYLKEEYAANAIQSMPHSSKRLPSPKVEPNRGSHPPRNLLSAVAGSQHSRLSKVSVQGKGIFMETMPQSASRS